MKAFVENAAFTGFLNRSWSDEKGYTDTGKPIANAERLQLLTYHTYQALAKSEASAVHLARAEKLSLELSNNVSEDGLLQENGGVTDHPAHGSSVADALGSFAFYGKKIGAKTEIISFAKDALLRIADLHPRIRPPGGLVGRTQQLRFETRVFYWAWRVTEQKVYRNYFMELMENGIHAYQHPVALEGGLVQPSLHPDFTWNYTCTSGTTTEYATNTHTPVYYATEVQGFVFVYLHGLKDGVLKRNPVWDAFCKKYFMGMFRNLSRAGHTACDLDGYGIHRAWYSSCLVESLPLEGCAAEVIGLDAQTVSWFRWYVDRYTDFVERSTSFEKTGLPETIPYGQKITIEKQFPALGGARLYAMCARAGYEYEIEKIKSAEVPAFTSYAWWHRWLRVSTPVYETSFVGTTSLLRIPVAKHFGDPHLGCMHGGSPLSNLFCGNELLYATSNDSAGLWHVELQDMEGNVTRSIATSFDDDTATSVLTSEGTFLNEDDFENYEEPKLYQLGEKATVVKWWKNSPSGGFRFFVRNAYLEKSFSSRWGFCSPQGHSLKKAAFCLAIPKDLSPEWKDGSGVWRSLSGESEGEIWPAGIRWKRGNKTATVLLESGNASKWTSRAIPTDPGRPGGENSFSPFPTLQLRLEVPIKTSLEKASMQMKFLFS